MRFVFKVLVLVLLIVVSKFVKEDEKQLAVAPVQVKQATELPAVYNNFETKPTLPQANQANVEKASLQF